MKPRFSTLLWTGLALAVAWACNEQWPGPLFQALAIVLALGAMWAGVDLALFTAARRQADFLAARSAAEQGRIQAYREYAREIRQMSSEQLEAYGRQRVGIETVPGIGTDPLYTLVMPDARVPWDFVEVFVGQADEQHLPALRRWGEGSKHRGYAEALTTHFVSNRFAVANNSNEPAKWVNPRARDEGLRSIGWNDGGEE